MDAARILLEAVEEVARVAGAVALDRYKPGMDVELKGDGSPVTVADRAAERAAREWVTARFPHDGFLGEEYGLTNPEAPRRWIVDPIDGTKSFVRGVPLWGTLVAVAEGERVLAGAIHCAAAGELVAAAAGQGCWWNGVRCRASAIDALDRATVLVTDARFPDGPERREAFDALASAAWVVRTWGDCYGYLLVATGRAEAMIDDRMSPWDAAALQPVIEEAGGAFTDWRGRPTAFGGDSIATNAALADEVRRRLGATEHAAREATGV